MHFFNQIAYFKEIVLDRKFLVSELGKILDVLNHLKNELHAQVEILKLIVELALVTSKVYSIRNIVSPWTLLALLYPLIEQRGGLDVKEAIKFAAELSLNCQQEELVKLTRLHPMAIELIWN